MSELESWRASSASSVSIEDSQLIRFLKGLPLWQDFVALSVEEGLGSQLRDFSTGIEQLVSCADPL